MGAVTWSSGTAGITGVVSSANSLVGSTANDNVGIDNITLLKNGNYVVGSSSWNHVGAVTWANGTTGITGPVSASNSLVGSNTGDGIGGSGITALSNGNYVVCSTGWANGAATAAGAVTWGNGTTGITGPVSAANSLVGTLHNDRVGESEVTALSNGNYVVKSPFWANSMGAATWGSGTAGVAGVVSAANSLVGDFANDEVGNTVIEVSNSNYIVDSYTWHFNTGAVTWSSGTTGITGTITAANSLVGSNAGDQIGNNYQLLSNGNFVTESSTWNSKMGAVTWINGATGIQGVVSASNSLTGSTANDQVGSSAAKEVGNGNFVVNSPLWNGSMGAVTWGSGTSGLVGTVSSANSLVGSNANDQIGTAFADLTPLTNGNYVVRSPNWNGSIGAVTWGSGATGVQGVVSAANSLVGGTASDQVGSNAVSAFSDGNYGLLSPNWANGAATGAGEVTLGSGSSGTAGTVSSSNSVLGTAMSGGSSMVFSYDTLHAQIVVGRPADNIVTIFGSGVSGSPDLTAALSHSGNFRQGDTGKTYTITVTNSGTLSTNGTITATITTLPAGLSATAFTGTGWTQTNLAPPTATFSGVLASSASNNALTLTVNVASNAGSPLTPVVTVSGGGETNTANDTANDPTTVTPVVSNPNPVMIVSGPTAQPSTAGVGQSVTFSASASGGTGTLTYSWNFGDGSPVATGATVTHAYAVAMIFTATLTVTDTAAGSASGSVMVTVVAPIVGTGNDSDGDGFSDSFETALGFNINDPNSNPLGRPIVAGDLQLLTLTKPSIKLNFKTPNKDSISFSGTLPVPAGFVVTGAKVYFDVGEVDKVVALGGKPGNDSIKITIKAKKGVVAAQTAAYKATFKNGSFAAALATSGLTNANAKAVPVKVAFTVIFNNVVFQKTQSMSYTATKGKSGEAK